MKKIFLVEDHQTAYGLWKKYRLNKMTLIHFDAHHDCDINYLTLDQEKYIQMGNFISNVLHQNIAGVFYWIVPGFSREYQRYYNRLVQLLYQLKQKDYTRHATITEGKNYLKTKILNKKFIITTIDFLPRMNKKVLLDIDLDYFIIKSLYKDRADDDIGLREPWISLSAFNGYLREKKMQFDYATISYSVNGGWTPMKYKYLGDMLAKELGFRSKDNDVRILAGKIFYDFRQEFERNNLLKARKYYISALSLNPAYFSFDNNYGKLYLMKGKVPEAKEEFNKMLIVDKNYYYSYIGLGISDLMEKKYQQALLHFNQALSISPHNLMVLVLKTFTFYHLGEYQKCKEIIKNNNRLQRVSMLKLAINKMKSIGQTNKDSQKLQMTPALGNSNLLEQILYAATS